MGHFNIRLDDIHTEKFKELKKTLDCRDNDEVVQKLIAITQEYLEEKQGKREDN